HIEARGLMTDKPSLGERVSSIANKVLPRGGAKQPVRLFTRLDIHKALAGYGKVVHCDRPNRLCSFIVYFCDADALGLEGGDLTLHKHRLDKPITDYERHPKPEDAPVIATLRPRENQGVFFPCCNNSYHGVTPVASAGAERDYLYINISGDAGRLW
ncbi:MAG: 2OG-Fe(II) oxygenase, partial [Caulobacterales bacterium]|nr:2OG-Fe(II) oxygenase [Caulobacterales bacterium]